MFPVFQGVKGLFRGTRTTKWLLASAAAIALAAPAVAQAGRNDGGRADQPRVEQRAAAPREVEHRDNDHRDVDHRDIDRRDADHRDDDRRGVMDYQPVIIDQPAVQQRWVEPVYQTVTEQVWVPDQYQDQEVRYVEHGRRLTRIEHVLTVPGHYETQTRQVCVSEGHWEACD